MANVDGGDSGSTDDEEDCEDGEMVFGAPVTYDNGEGDVTEEGQCRPAGEPVIMNPLLNGHETVEERGDFEWVLSAVPSNGQRVKVR